MRELNQRRIRYFYEVFQERSIRRAAENLNTAPSVISRQIQLLEEELSAPLFERQARGLAPTEAAFKLIEFWRGCQAQQEKLEDSLKALKTLEEGEVRIVVSEGYLEGLMDQVISPFCMQYPRVKVALDLLPVQALTEELLENRAHIALAFNPASNSGVSQVASATQPIELLLRKDHPLTRLGRRLQIKDLLAHPFAMMPGAYGLGSAIQMLAYAENIELEPSLVTNSLAALRHFVQKTDGITLIGNFSAISLIERGELVTLPLQHPMLVHTQTQLLTKKGRPLPMAAEELLRWITDRMELFKA